MSGPKVADKIPPRLAWAVETLSVQPGDRILEIGCGHGLAIALICERLVGGNITAIDQSQKMVDVASTRNREHIVSGTAAVHARALADANFGEHLFDKVFAVNVNLFWTRSAPELDLIRSMLAPDGELYLFYQPPNAAKARETAVRVGKNLLDHGFSVRRELSADLIGGAAVCLVSAPELR